MNTFHVPFHPYCRVQSKYYIGIEKEKYKERINFAYNNLNLNCLYMSL